MNNIFQIKILEIDKEGIYAFFECSNGDYGYLEPVIGDVNVGDILEFYSKNGPKCGLAEFPHNRQKKIRCFVHCLNSKEEAYNEFLYNSK